MKAMKKTYMMPATRWAEMESESTLLIGSPERSMKVMINENDGVNVEDGLVKGQSGSAWDNEW